MKRKIFLKVVVWSVFLFVLGVDSSAARKAADVHQQRCTVTVKADTSSYEFSVIYTNSEVTSPVEPIPPGGVPMFQNLVDDVCPRVVIADNGYRHVVWMGRLRFGGPWDIYYGLVNDEGFAVTDCYNVMISDAISVLPSVYPAITLDSDGNAHVVWVDSMFGNWEIVYRKLIISYGSVPSVHKCDTIVPLSDLDGHNSGRVVDPFSEYETWACPSNPGTNPIVKIDTRYLEHPDIAVDSDDSIHVVWSDHRDYTWQIYYQKQSNDSIPYVSVNDRMISSYPTCNAYSPAIAIAHLAPRLDEVHIVWHNDWYDNLEIFYELLDDTGYVCVDDQCVSGDDGYNSASPDIAVSDTCWYYAWPGLYSIHIVWMDDRPQDPGHPDEVHVDWQWEVYIQEYKKYSGGENPLHHGNWGMPKRLSDLTAGGLYGNYTGPPDGPSMYPRIRVMGTYLGGSQDPGTKITWQDLGHFNSALEEFDWEIRFTENDNWCHNPEENLNVSEDLDHPDKYPDIAANNNYDGHPDIKYQAELSPPIYWEIKDAPWDTTSGVWVEILTTTDTFRYDAYRENPYDTNAADGIVYVWKMIALRDTLKEYRFIARDTLYNADTTDWEATPSTSREVAVDIAETSVESNFWILGHPNPSKSPFTISYYLPHGGKVSLKVYDASGRFVNALVDKWQERGHYRTIWDGRDESDMKVPTGIYFYRIEAGQLTRTKKMVLMR